MQRRTFLAGISMAVTGAAKAWAQAAPMETFTQWMRASRPERDAAVKACLRRIEELDPKIQAWVQVAAQPALAAGALGGIPFGAKDIMETRGLATEDGLPIDKGRLGSSDAAIVTSLRRRGAILLGKTHTTAFAYRTPAPTRNPRHLEHTPGGGSSGSAAASRPACAIRARHEMRGRAPHRIDRGVTGLKPSYGRLPTKGVLPLCEEPGHRRLLHPHTGLHARTLGSDGHPSGRDETLTFGVPDPMPEVDADMLTSNAAGARYPATRRHRHPSQSTSPGC